LTLPKTELGVTGKNGKKSMQTKERDPRDRSAQLTLDLASTRQYAQELLRFVSAAAG
jgi:hypothetical protein